MLQEVSSLCQESNSDFKQEKISDTEEQKIELGTKTKEESAQSYMSAQEADILSLDDQKELVPTENNFCK